MHEGAAMRQESGETSVPESREMCVKCIKRLREHRTEN